jgi:hypothetical protein
MTGPRQQAEGDLKYAGKNLQNAIGVERRSVLLAGGKDGLAVVTYCLL